MIYVCAVLAGLALVCIRGWRLAVLEQRRAVARRLTAEMRAAEDRRKLDAIVKKLRSAASRRGGDACEPEQSGARSPHASGTGIPAGGFFASGGR